MNPVLILTRNNLELTKRCVESVRAQDVETDVLVLDNDSTDGTVAWMDETLRERNTRNLGLMYEHPQIGVSAGWNKGLTQVFGYPRKADYCLVIGNDTVLAPWTYSALLSSDVSFVTGVDIGMNPLPEKPGVFPLSPHPDFSCFLIRRECWEKVGPFDERMVMYAQDCDYHVRAHRAGVPLWKASVPYQHERSSTLNRATPEDRAAIHAQANKDRAVFRELYGCTPGTPQYEDLFR